MRAHLDINYSNNGSFQLFPHLFSLYIPTEMADSDLRIGPLHSHEQGLSRDFFFMFEFHDWIILCQGSNDCKQLTLTTINRLDSVTFSFLKWEFVRDFSNSILLRVLHSWSHFIIMVEFSWMLSWEIIHLFSKKLVALPRRGDCGTWAPHMLGMMAMYNFFVVLEPQAESVESVERASSRWQGE